MQRVIKGTLLISVIDFVYGLIHFPYRRDYNRVLKKLGSGMSQSLIQVLPPRNY